MTTPTRDKPITPIADSPTWPRHANGNRIKPLGVLLSAAGRDKHCGKDTTVGHCISVQLRYELELIRQTIEMVAANEGNANAGSLAALELAICLVEISEESDLSAAQFAWSRNESR